MRAQDLGLDSLSDLVTVTAIGLFLDFEPQGFQIPGPPFFPLRYVTSTDSRHICVIFSFCLSTLIWSNIEYFVDWNGDTDIEEKWLMIFLSTLIELSLWLALGDLKETTEF